MSGRDKAKSSGNLATSSSSQDCKDFSRPQPCRICSAAFGKLGSAGTWRIRTIRTFGQRSFAITPHSNPTAIEFTTCSIVSICAVDLGRHSRNRASFLLDARQQTLNVRCFSYANIYAIINRSSRNQKTAQRQGARGVRPWRDTALCRHGSNLRL